MAPDWVRGDMRWLPFAQQFGGALLLDSFGYFDLDDDNLHVLRELRRVLQPAARVIVAAANPRPILADFRTTDVEKRGSVVLEIDRSLQRSPAVLVEKLAVHDGGSLTHYERRQRLYSRVELQAQLEAAGLAVQDVFADYTGSSFDDALSPKTVILAHAAV